MLLLQFRIPKDAATRLDDKKEHKLVTCHFVALKRAIMMNSNSILENKNSSASVL